MAITSVEDGSVKAISGGRNYQAKGTNRALGKYNYDYVVSLIEQLPAEHIAVYCSDMDFDYLKHLKDLYTLLDINHLYLDKN